MVQESSSSGSITETDKKSKTKSGRTAEQQAARDARKAAKAASASASAAGAGAGAEPSTTAELEAEAEAESSTKRKRAAGEDTNEEELEIDVAAPAPLSKAEARANRKKLKRGEAVPEGGPKREYEEVAKRSKRSSDQKDGEGEGGEAKGVKGGGEEAPKKQNSIWIGNLSFRTTEESLKEFFLKGLQELGGTAKEGAGMVTRVNLPKKKGKGTFAENKGFAYVDFATPELQALGVGLSERFFEGRRVLIKRGDDHAANPDARTPKPITIQSADMKITSKHPESSSLYMGNMPFDATELGIRDMVEANAPERSKEEALADEGADSIGERGGVMSGLKKVRLGAFEDTGRCKGFAFLDFISSRHARVALSTRKNHFYGGRRLTVEFASEEAVKRGGGRVRPKLASEGGKKLPRSFEQSTQSAQSGDLSEGQPEEGESAKVPGKNDKRGKKWEVTGRPRPGAALALAKRESVAIVKGTGEKITFD